MEHRHHCLQARVKVSGDGRQTSAHVSLGRCWQQSLAHAVPGVHSRQGSTQACQAGRQPDYNHKVCWFAVDRSANGCVWTRWEGLEFRAAAEARAQDVTSHSNECVRYWVLQAGGD